MIFASPFPPTVAFAHCGWDEHTVGDLAPDEAAALSARAVPKRVREFVAGRMAARRAMTALGLAPVPPVPPGADRAPCWPADVVGAITHTREHALAAVAHAGDCAGLGLDLEHVAGVRRLDIARAVADATEQAWISAAPEPEARRRLVALFSAKESVFKALYPQVQRFFGFDAVTSRFDEAGGAFDLTLREPLAPGWPAGASLRVGVTWYGDFVLTSLCLPPLRGANAPRLW